MYVEIKDNKLLSWCEKPYSDYVYVDIDYSTFEPDKYSVINGVLTNISYTQEYTMRKLQKQKQTEIENLKSQINELDTKRIRAIAEPSDKEEGLSWLKHYTNQIISLREQLADLY